MKAYSITSKLILNDESKYRGHTIQWGALFG